jgi:thymidylate synthase
MKQYIDLIKQIVTQGVEKTDRTGTGTISIFGHQSTYDVSKTFPLLSAKNTYQNGFIIELLWFIGTHMNDERYSSLSRTNIKYLVDNNVNIWNEWPYKAMINYQREVTEKVNTETGSNLQSAPISLLEFKNRIKNEEGFAEKWGDLGPVYGKQWRQWQGWMNYTDSHGKIGQGSLWFDQLLTAIQTLKTKPDDRGIIISAWNVSELNQMALRPCHTMFQLNTEPIPFIERLKLYEDKISVDTDDVKTDIRLDQLGVPKYKLSLQLYQRSADVFLGVPFNVASYSLLLHMIAQVTVNELLNRVYLGHGSDEYMNKDLWVDWWKYPNNFKYLDEHLKWPELPVLNLNPDVENIEDFTRDDIQIINYKPWPKIDAPVAV